MSKLNCKLIIFYSLLACTSGFYRHPSGECRIIKNAFTVSIFRNLISPIDKFLDSKKFKNKPGKSIHQLSAVI